MRTKTVSTVLKSLAVSSLIATPFHSALATNLSVGADYFVRYVSMQERDKSIKDNKYYDSRLEAYLTTDLSKDVEASIRVQSITPWGLEGSTNPLVSRYPNANGNVWVQNAYVRLPNLWKNKMVLTAGRQPITWGDGAILSDDDLGFNAIRFQLKSPLRFLPVDVDGFTAKISEGLRGPGDTDLNGVNVSFDREIFRWELMGLWEHSDGAQPYQVGAGTTPFTASSVSRQIYGVRAKTNIKDAFLRGELYLQKGTVKQPFAGAQETTLDGMGYVVGLGGKAVNKFVGRFGAILELAVGSGDDPSTTDVDEAFRPTFASRWSGLERKGYGRYFAANMSDAYSPNDPFGNATSVNTGLEPGVSGIQTIHFGVDSTPWAEWTFLLDFYQYKAQKNLNGDKDLGSEIDYGVEYRYSGLVTFKGYMGAFKPGKAFLEATRQSANTMGAEIEIKF